MGHLICRDSVISTVVGKIVIMPSKKPKRGRPFEEAVAEVVRAIDPRATVRQGEWIEGPDGRRDRDVFISGTVGGAQYNALVECKDYSRHTTGPVGIGVVDALDSKRRDLKVNIAIICSNAGFTKPAARKAARVGIVLIGAFRESDERIRHQLIDQVYFRRLKIQHLGFRLEYKDPDAKHECLDASATFQGRPVANWLCHRVVRMITLNPIGGGHYAGSFDFKHPVEFTVADGRIFVATQMFSEVFLSGGWFEQSAVIDGTAGVYDFLRRRVQVGTGPHQLHLKGMDLTKGSPIDFPPKTELDISTGGFFGEVWLQFLYLQDANCHEPVPPLDDVIVERDLDLEITGLPPELQRAPGAFSSTVAQTQFFVSRNPKVGPDHSFTLTSPGVRQV
jgi:hypothetical protein